MEKDSFKYLKSELYYSDLYDKFTVEECRRWEKMGVGEDWAEVKDDAEDEKETKMKEQMKVTLVLPTMLYVIKGERYADKNRVIAEWMNADRAKDEKLDNAKEPQNIFCSNCNSVMRFMDKHFFLDRDKNQDEVIFFFECPMCKKRRLIWEDGREWKYRVSCEKCKGEAVKETSKREGNIITTVYVCELCGHRKEDIWDMGEKIGEPEKPDPAFAEDKKRFCLSQEEGEKYIEGMARMKHATETIKEIDQKAEIRKQVSDIKKLNIADLTQLLCKVIEKEYYIKLELSKPEIGRDVVINFTVQDNKSGRPEYDSIRRLKNIFKTGLNKTNWHLMSDGIFYKLGILSGRLRGYENDEDLLKLKENSKE